MTGDRNAIVVRNLTKTFQVRRRRNGRFASLASYIRPSWAHHRAVSDLSLTIERGELVAVLGPNGAGKSTTIKMLAGILTPTSGTIEVDGRDPSSDRIGNSRSIGVVFGQKTQLWWDLPAIQSFMLLRDMYGLDAGTYQRRIEEFDDTLGLRSFWDTPVRNLSLGQRVRCDVAAAMLHDPPIIYLDEPTIGMDVEAKERTRDFLRRQVREFGRTIILTTHDMVEVQRLCQRVVLINKGTIVFDGHLNDLRHAFAGGRTVDVTFGDGWDPGSIAQLSPELLDDRRARVKESDDMAAEEIVKVIAASCPIVKLAIDEPSLDDIMVSAFRAQKVPGR